MNERGRIRLRAYPVETSVVCLAREERAIMNLAASLRKSGINKSSLISAGGLCLGIRVKTKQLPRLLPRICEHSDTVCIGKSYTELFCEHGQILIKSGALQKLFSEQTGGSGHIL